MKRIVYITATLPALTVTFIYNEIFRLRELGSEIDTVSMNTPPENQISGAARPLRDTTLYLDQVSIALKLLGCAATAVRHPLRFCRCIAHLVTARPVRLPRDFFRNAYHLLEAGYLAHSMRHKPPDHVHSHFINGPTTIAMFTGLLVGVPYSFTMHASMIWKDPVAFRNKLDTCSFCVSISDYNRRYVLETYGQRYASRFNIVHCGIDPGASIPERAGKQGHGPLRILGVGQLNARKGFHVLLPALAELKKQGIDFSCIIVGDGPERQALERQKTSLGLGEELQLTGARLHEEVKAMLPDADLFVLPCVISSDGWRDGIPVALMEAMQARLPVISTNILGLPELISDGEEGLLVPPDDPMALQAAIRRISEDPELGIRLGEAARQKVLREFNNDKSAAMLHELIEGARQ